MTTPPAHGQGECLQKGAFFALFTLFLGEKHMNMEEKNLPGKTEKTDTVSGVNENNGACDTACDTPAPPAQKAPESTQNGTTGAPKCDKTPQKAASCGRKLPPRTKKRLILVGTVIGILLVAMVALLVGNAIASSRPPEFSTVRDRFGALIRDSLVLNQAVFGEGLPVYTRFKKDLQAYTVNFKEKERTLRYYVIEDAEYGTVVSYEYQIQIMDGKVNADGIKIYTVYDVQTGKELPELKNGASRFVQKSTEQREGYVYQKEEYYYYPLENYENPDLVYAEVYSGEEDENYDYVRFDCSFKSTDDLQLAIKSVYSEAYISYIYEILFTGTVDLRGDVIQALYIDYYDEDSGMGFLMRSNKSWEWRAIPTVVYDFSTMEMVESESSANSVCVRIRGHEQGKESEPRDYLIWFARENGIWYLDSPTY